MNDTTATTTSQPQDRPPEHEVHPDSIAVKRWLRMAVDSQGMLPKQIYLDLGVDAGTWSRWTSYEHEQTIPSGLLARVIDILGTAALNDLIAVLGRRA